MSESFQPADPQSRSRIRTQSLNLTRLTFGAAFSVRGSFVRQPAVSFWSCEGENHGGDSDGLLCYWNPVQPVLFSSRGFTLVLSDVWEFVVWTFRTR